MAIYGNAPLHHGLRTHERTCSVHNAPLHAWIDLLRTGIFHPTVITNILEACIIWRHRLSVNENEEGFNVQHLCVADDQPPQPAAQAPATKINKARSSAISSVQNYSPAQLQIQPSSSTWDPYRCFWGLGRYPWRVLSPPGSCLRYFQPTKSPLGRVFRKLAAR